MPEGPSAEVITGFKAGSLPGAFRPRRSQRSPALDLTVLSLFAFLSNGDNKIVSLKKKHIMKINKIMYF